MDRDSVQPVRRLARTGPLVAQLVIRRLIRLGGTRQPRFNSTRDRCQPALRDLHVVLRRVEARSDGADHLAINNYRRSTLHFREALRRDGSNATVVDRILKRLTWFLEKRGCSSLAGRQLTLAR
jgi:hypothetical protein